MSPTYTLGRRVTSRTQFEGGEILYYGMRFRAYFRLFRDSDPNLFILAWCDKNGNIHQIAPDVRLMTFEKLWRHGFMFA